MNITILGLPGAGKGTQAKNISAEYGLDHIGTGDIFRRHIEQGTQLGKKAEKYIAKGNLVPDDITIPLVKKFLEEKEFKKGIVLDGFPRTLKQARALSKIMGDINKKLDCAIFIQVSPEKLVNRLSDRRVCLNCGDSYHLKYNPPQKKGVCDNCSAELIQRKDDSREMVSERIEKQTGQLEKIIKYYKKKNKLKIVQGEGIEEKFLQIKKIIEVEE